jgi:transposase
MSLKPRRTIEIPPETKQLAEKLYKRKPTVAFTMAQELSSVFEDEEFTDLFPTKGQPAQSPAVLATVVVLQFTEGLTDRQAEEASRSRVDWKYATALPLDHPGIEHTVICEFRSRLLENGAEWRLFEKLLEEFRKRGLIKERGRQRTDSTNVLAAVRELNRLERVGETMRATLNALMDEAPEFLQDIFKGEWHERYGRPFFNMRLPKEDSKREKLGVAIGRDGFELLQAIAESSEKDRLEALAEIMVLRQVWDQEYIEKSDKSGGPRFRKPEEMKPASERIASPYDPEARWSTKRDHDWVGYKVHITETCDKDLPRLITNVATTAATTNDQHMLEPIHKSLAARNLLPSEHLVDRGYTNGESLAFSKRDYDVTVIGEVTEDHSWRVRQGEGFEKANFAVNWEKQVVTCPAGVKSSSWKTDRTGHTQVEFSQRRCRGCPNRGICVGDKAPNRTLSLQPQIQEEALQAARERQKTEEFKNTYALRAGVEGIISQTVRRCGLRRTPYVGMAKTQLQHILVAVAVNVIKFTEWVHNVPLARTRKPRFAALQAA